MTRLSHRSRTRPTDLVGPATVIALLVAGVYGGVALATAEAPSPTVTFGGGRLAPVVCASSPSSDRLLIEEGIWVNLVNRTGASVWVSTNGSPGPEIPDGEGRSVLLSAGRHNLRLVPGCAVLGQVDPLVIEVEAPPTSTRPARPGSGGRAGSYGGSGPDAALAGTDGGLVNSVPFPVDGAEDPGNAHLLAIVAAICVLGVTAAIIRAILAQRATRTIGR